MPFPPPALETQNEKKIQFVFLLDAPTIIFFFWILYSRCVIATPVCLCVNFEKVCL